MFNIFLRSWLLWNQTSVLLIYCSCLPEMMELNRRVLAPSLKTTHCKVGISFTDWRMEIKLLMVVLFNDSPQIDITSGRQTDWPERCHSVLGDGFPWNSQEHTIKSWVLLQLEEGESWEASEREREPQIS